MTGARATAPVRHDGLHGRNCDEHHIDHHQPFGAPSIARIPRRPSDAWRTMAGNRIERQRHRRPPGSLALRPPSRIRLQMECRLTCISPERGCVADQPQHVLRSGALRLVQERHSRGPTRCVRLALMVRSAVQPECDCRHSTLRAALTCWSCSASAMPSSTSLSAKVCSSGASRVGALWPAVPGTGSQRLLSGRLSAAVGRGFNRSCP